MNLGRKNNDRTLDIGWYWFVLCNYELCFSVCEEEAICQVWQFASYGDFETYKIKDVGSELQVTFYFKKEEYVPEDGATV